MKIVCTQENLKTGLSAASKIISSSLTLPVLNTVLLKTESGQLQISATNLEIAINTYVRCKIDTEGGVCVPAKPFSDLVNSLPNKNITLELKGTELLISTETASAKLKTISPEEFPIIPTVEGGEVVHLPAESFKIALDQVVFASANSEAQPEISSVLFSFNDKSLKLVATDRYRLAERLITLEKPTESRKLLVPNKTVSEISRIIGSSQGNIEIQARDTQILFRFQETQVVSRLIDGNFPPYEEIIPKNFETIIEVKKQALGSALKTASVFSEGSHTIHFSYEDSLKIKAISENFGEGNAEVEAIVTGPAGEIVFNHRYIQDALSVIEGDTVTVKIINNTSPVIFSPKNKIEYLYLVMPITT